VVRMALKETCGKVNGGYQNVQCVECPVYAGVGIGEAKLIDARLLA
jgi:hypothetical protein